MGDNPDRPRPGRLWLRNLYHVHQRLCMAFPSPSRKSDDPDFLKPFKPQDFGRGQVHVARKTDAGFLFRIDPRLAGGVAILVQSAVEPDWDYAFHNAGYLLAAPCQIKEFDPRLVCRTGATWRFRLRANPTVKREEKRHALLSEDQQTAWLRRKADAGGFAVLSVTASRDGPRAARKTDYDAPEPKEHRITLFAVRFDGLLKVTDDEAFLGSLCCGIGSGQGIRLRAAQPGEGRLMDDLTQLTRFGDRLSFLYLEKGHIEQHLRSIAYVTEKESIPIPAASLALLMLGPGTTITHAAIKNLADCNCLVAWCGDEGTRFYSHGRGGTYQADKLLRQAELYCNQRTRAPGGPPHVREAIWPARRAESDD